MTACELAFSNVSYSGWIASCQETGLLATLASWGFVLVCVVALLALFIVLAKPSRSASWRISPWVSAFSLVIAAALLAIAAGRPVLLHDPAKGQHHFIFVIDQSESAHRLEGERKARLQALVRDVTALAQKEKDDTVVSVVDFAAGVDVKLNRGSLQDGMVLLLQDQASKTLAAEGSDIVSALKDASALADEENDEDVIFLLSDGNATTANLVDLIPRLRGRLRPVHAISLSAGAAAEGIVSSYLPASVEAGSAPSLRFVFDPGKAAGEKDWAIELKRQGKAIALDTQLLQTNGAVEGLRLPVRFDGRGVQYASVGLSQGNKSFRERSFTLVNSPVRVLGLGDTDFLSVLPKDHFWVDRRQDADLDGLDNYDVLVLSGLKASRLGAKALHAIYEAVASRGLGLFLVNGPLQGSRQAQTVVQSYGKTKIDPLLPVSPDPKFMLEDPPPRDTIILVDTSGSMSGGGLDAARGAVADILDYTRPQDSLQIITFGGLTSGRQKGDAQGKGVIRDFASRFPIGDSSNVSRAFEAALATAGNYTSVFLITDGMVDPYDYAKAGLSFYYLQYGSGSASLNEEIAKAARQSQILQTGQGLSFKPASFDPKEKAEYYSPDRVLPRVVSPIENISGGIATDGVAFSYARADATRALVSDGVEGEPVLAFRTMHQLQAGSTGAFLSGLTGAWTDSEAGKRAITASLMHLVKWSQRSRYAFRIKDLGEALSMRVSVQSADGEAKLPQTLSVTLVVGDHKMGIPMVPVAEGKGVFEGEVPLLAPEMKKGLLYIEEGGAFALHQPQVIPIELPPALPAQADGREASTYGVNLAGLRALVDASGGSLDRLPDARNMISAMTVPPRPVHVTLLILACVFFGLSFVVKGARL
nr:VWA domain-containing protein [uncultured Cohaesibacter sp.]